MSDHPMTVRDVIFDLDGTLVDSAPDILETLRLATREAGLHSDTPLTTALIGPPVREMLSLWGAGFSAAQLDAAVSAFRRLYDASSMPLTLPYAGILECLRDLRAAGCRVFVATNKPQKPTQKLIDLHFRGMVEDFCCVDSIEQRKLSKLEMLVELAGKHQVAPSVAAIVGDGVADLRAGKAFGCGTVAALYGYGSAASLRAEQPNWEADAPASIVQCLVR